MNTYKVPQQDVLRTLDVKVMMKEAVEATGLDDYGELDFVEALQKMVECYADDGDFHASGLSDFRQNIIRDLINRLRFRDDLKKHPEIHNEDVSDPIVIMGLPRSGTTKFHRMMGADPSLLNTYMWQMLNPAPFPDAPPGQLDPRITAAYGQDSILADVPEIRAGHYFHVNAIEDCNFLFGATFNNGWSIAGRTRSTSFDEWTRTRKSPSDLDNFLYVRSVFQYLQWQQGGKKGRRWLMKSTGHLGYIQELLVAHPNATLVHLHRHPRSSVASVAKLTSALWAQRAVDVSLEFAGKYWLNRDKLMMDKYLKDRDRLDLDGRIIDVKYEQIRSHPMPAIREIYHRAGHLLTADAERDMIEWEKGNEQGKHGSHAYSLEQFGLSEQLIDDAFGSYIQRFIDA